MHPWQRVGWWTYLAHRHDSLPVWGRDHWAVYHSYPYYYRACWYIMAWPWRWPQTELHLCPSSQAQSPVVHSPDPVSHPHWWIQEEMLKIPHIHWWKTLMPSGKRMMFSHILCKSLSKPKTLHLAQLQAAAFQLPQAQQEAAGWWVSPLTIPRLHLKDHMPSPHFIQLLGNETAEDHDLS